MIRPEILLHPNIVKPLHGLAPREIKGKSWWDKQRQIAYQSTDFHCAACGIHKSRAKYHKWLEAHELYEFDYPRGQMIFKEIVPLCHSCHNFIHSGRLQILFDKGEIEEEKYLDIMDHGNLIIKKHKLIKPAPPVVIAPWEKWRLIFEGKEYAGKFKNFAAWKSHYNR